MYENFLPGVRVGEQPATERGGEDFCLPSAPTRGNGTEREEYIIRSQRYYKIGVRQHLSLSMISDSIVRAKSLYKTIHNVYTYTYDIGVLVNIRDNKVRLK